MRLVLGVSAKGVYSHGSDWDGGGQRQFDLSLVGQPSPTSQGEARTEERPSRPCPHLPYSDHTCQDHKDHDHTLVGKRLARQGVGVGVWWREDQWRAGELREIHGRSY